MHFTITPTRRNRLGSRAFRPILNAAQADAVLEPRIAPAPAFLMTLPNPGIFSQVQVWDFWGNNLVNNLVTSFVPGSMNAIVGDGIQSPSIATTIGTSVTNEVVSPTPTVGIPTIAINVAHVHQFSTIFQPANPQGYQVWSFAGTNNNAPITWQIIDAAPNAPPTATVTGSFSIHYQPPPPLGAVGTVAAGAAFASTLTGVTIATVFDPQTSSTNLILTYPTVVGGVNVLQNQVVQGFWDSGGSVSVVYQAIVPSNATENIAYASALQNIYGETAGTAVTTMLDYHFTMAISWGAHFSSSSTC